MKNKNSMFITILAFSTAISSYAQPTPLREATVVEMQAGTMGMPAVVTPRRSVGGLSSNLVNTTVWNIRNIYPNVGMGAIATNVIMQAGSSTLTSSNTFTLADVGKKILVYGVNRDTNSLGLVATNCISTTINAFVDAHTITLGASAPFGTTNTFGTAFVNQPSAVYGFDDSTNIQSFLNLVYSNGLGRTYYPKGIYVIANPINDPNVGTNNQHFNAQLNIPLVQGQGQWSPVLQMEGEAAMSSQDPYGNGSFFPGNSTLNGNGTIFWSFYVPTNGSVQDPDQGEAMLTCKNYTNYIFMGGSSIGAYPGQNQVGLNAVHLIIKNMNFFCPANPHLTALDIRGCQAAQLDTIGVGTGGGFGNGRFFCIYTNAYGIRFPVNFNPGNNSARNFVVQDFYTDIELGEHIDLYSFWLTHAYNGIQTRVGGHQCTIYGGDIEVCVNDIFCYTNNYGGGNLTGFAFGLTGDITTETGGGNEYGLTQVGINDGNNNLYGSLHIQSTSGGFSAIGGNYMTWLLSGTNGSPEILQHQGWESFANGISIGGSRSLPSNSHVSSVPQYVFDGRGLPFQLLSRFNNNSKQMQLWYEDTGNVFFNTTGGGVAGGYEGGGETNLNLFYGFFAGGATNIITNSLVLLKGAYYGDGKGITNLPYVKTITSSNLTFVPTVNADGSTNAQLNLAQNTTVTTLTNHGNFTVDAGGSFVGNGSGITNIPSSALVGAGLNHTPVAVTVGASPFSFTNNTPNYLEVYLTDSAAFTVSKHGTTITASLASDADFILQPTNYCTITYASTTPTMNTNAW